MRPFSVVTTMGTGAVLVGVIALVPASADEASEPEFLSAPSAQSPVSAEGDTGTEQIPRAAKSKAQTLGRAARRALVIDLGPLPIDLSPPAEEEDTDTVVPERRRIGAIAPSRASSRAISRRISTGRPTRTADTRRRSRSRQRERSHCASPSRLHCPLALRFRYSMARASCAALPSRQRPSTPARNAPVMMAPPGWLARLLPTNVKFNASQRHP